MTTTPFHEMDTADSERIKKEIFKLNMELGCKRFISDFNHADFDIADYISGFFAFITWVQEKPDVSLCKDVRELVNTIIKCYEENNAN